MLSVQGKSHIFFFLMLTRIPALSQRVLNKDLDGRSKGLDTDVVGNYLGSSSVYILYMML